MGGVVSAQRNGVIGPYGWRRRAHLGQRDADTDTERGTVADQDERQHRPRDRALVERVRLVRESKLKLTEREDDADARDRAADARDRTADQRDHRADERDRALEPGK